MYSRNRKCSIQEYLQNAISITMSDPWSISSFHNIQTPLNMIQLYVLMYPVNRFKFPWRCMFIDNLVKAFLVYITDVTSHLLLYRRSSINHESVSKSVSFQEVLGDLHFFLMVKLTKFMRTFKALKCKFILEFSLF